MTLNNVQKKVNVELLEDLYEALMSLDETADFNLDFWAAKRIPDSPQLNCGTVACAIGLGTTLPSWRAQGFSMTPGTFVPQFVFKGEDGFEHKTYSWFAVERLLGLTDHQSSYLFSPAAYRPHERKNPRLVAARIRGFLDEAG